MLGGDRAALTIQIQIQIQMQIKILVCTQLLVQIPLQIRQYLMLVSEQTGLTEEVSQITKINSKANTILR